MKLTGHTILTTGRSAGIELSFAEYFGELGNEVIVTGRRQAALADIEQVDRRLYAIQSNVSGPAQIAQLATKLKRDFPRLRLRSARSRRLPSASDSSEFYDAMPTGVSVSAGGGIFINFPAGATICLRTIPGLISGFGMSVSWKFSEPPKAVKTWARIGASDWI